MAMLFDKPVISPILIGRAAYLESLERVVEQVRGGRGQTMIAGEAGRGLHWPTVRGVAA